MQSEFLDAIQDPHWVSGKDLEQRFPDLVHELTDESKSRFFIYRSSYWARVTVSLARSIYKPASDIVGEEGMIFVLRQYFSVHRPSEELMTDAARGLPCFLRLASSAPWASGCGDVRWLADVVDYCHLRWQLLWADDARGRGPIFDDTSLEHGLAGPAGLLQSGFPLDQLLAFSDASSGFSVAVDWGRPQTLMLCRVGVSDVVVLVVPSAAVSLARALTEGLTLDQAMEQLHEPEAGWQTHELDGVRSFVAQLAQGGLLTPR
jgi:hypothetical protein